MPVYLRPGVFTREQDISQRVQGVATSSGAIVINSNRGRVNERVLVTNSKQFLDEFGNPDTNGLSYGHYSALAFLNESNTLWVTRAARKGAAWAGVSLMNDGSLSTEGVVVGAGDQNKNQDIIDTVDVGALQFNARSPGVWGNNLKIRFDEVISHANKTFAINVIQSIGDVDVVVERWIISAGNSTNADGSSTNFKDVINGRSQYIIASGNPTFEDIPGLVPANVVIADTVAIDTAALNGIDLADNILPGSIAVYNGEKNAANLVGSDVPNAPNDDGVIVDGVVTFTIGDDVVSFTINYADGNSVNGSGTVNGDSGGSIIMENHEAINIDLVTDTDDWNLTGGLNNAPITDMPDTTGSLSLSPAEVCNGWDLYKDPDHVDVRMLIEGGLGSVGLKVQRRMKEICESRMDCIAILDAPKRVVDMDAQSLVSWRKNEFNINSSYASLYAPWLNVYDQFNDKRVTVPPSGHVAAIYARTDSQNETWFAPAGIRRGQISADSLTCEYSSGEQDLLYSNGINYIRNFPGRGIVLWGQKTLQYAASKLDRVNVRRMLIVLEKSIANSLIETTFELNTDFTRLQVQDRIDSFVRLIQDGGGLTEYKIVVDESNNPPEVIDSNELHVDVYLKPTSAAEFIQLQAVITRTGASFDELISSGGNLA